MSEESAIYDSWVAPPPLACLVRDHLARLSLIEKTLDDISHEESHRSIIIYPTPDQIIFDLEPTRYFEELAYLNKSDHFFISTWRLLSLTDNDIEALIFDKFVQPDLLAGVSPPPIDSILALITLRQIQENIRLLDSYVSLEEEVELFGSMADLSYTNRLEQYTNTRKLAMDYHLYQQLRYGSERGQMLSTVLGAVAIGDVSHLSRDLYRALAENSLLETDLRKTAMKNRWLRSSKSEIAKRAYKVNRHYSDITSSLLNLISRLIPLASKGY